MNSMINILIGLKKRKVRHSHPKEQRISVSMQDEERHEAPTFWIVKGGFIWRCERIKRQQALTDCRAKGGLISRVKGAPRIAATHKLQSQG